jgi:biotin transport system permease protein
MAGTAALILLGAFSAGIRPRELFTGSRPLMVMVIFTAVIKICKLSALLSGQWAAVVSVEELTGALRLSAGILISFTAGSLLFAVTTMTEIRHSLERAEHFLFRSRRLSLALALMLAFLPRFFELWEAAETAAKARGCTGTFRRVLVILPLVTERMIESAAETAAAMEARGVSV